MKKLLLNPNTASIKKFLLSLTVLMLLSFNLFSQNEVEKKLKIKDFPIENLTTIPIGKVDCKCEKNIVTDGGFENVTNYTASSNIAASSTPWKPNTLSPQWTPNGGACNKGYVQMWGNQAVFESIKQSVNIPAGSYTVKATLKYLNVNPLAPVTRLKVTAVNSPSAVSPNVTGSWVTYTFPLTVVSPGATSIVLQPENNSTLNDGNYVSWIQIDNICIERVPDPCDCINYPQKPAITGTTLACACDPIKFSTLKCPGASYSWTVTDNKGNNISYTSGGTNAISLNYSLAQQVASGATSFTVTVVIKCGDKYVTNTITVPIKPVPKTNVSFSLTDDGNGNYTATATGMAPGNGNGWTLKEVTCPGPNPCSWVAGPIKWQASGTSISIPNGVLVKGKCYVLTHYVNVCSATWISTPCTVYKATCFKLDGNQMRMPAARETDKNDAREITAEMLGDLRGIK